MNKYLVIAIIGALSVWGFLAAFLLFRTERVVYRDVEITIPAEFISTPALTQLNSNIVGVVVQKNDNSFVLSNDGKFVTIYLEPNGLTSFSREVPENLIDYDDVELGNTLSGGISIILNEAQTVGFSTNRRVGDIMGHNFNVSTGSARVISR